MARKPIPGSDGNNWGSVLNDYLDTLVPGPGEVIVGGESGPVAVPVESIGGGGSQPVELPSIPGLFFHLDAQAIVAADGARIGAWTDLIGGAEAVQPTEANQPAYRVNGINRKPALSFDNVRNDRLLATVAPTSHAPTIFVVTQSANFASGSRYFFGTNGTAKNVYVSSSGFLGIQGGVTFGAPGLHATPQIVVGTFNGASASIRVNTVETTGDTGAATTLPTQLSLGNRTSQAASNAFTGLIGEVLYYDRVLTTDEKAAVERYLAAKWSIPITPQRTWHVDSVYGTPTATGRTEAEALDSLTAAIASIKTAAVADATVVIHAPESRPIREPNTVIVDTGTTVRLVSRIPGQPWYINGTVRFTSGWTSQGGGVYSRPLTSAYTSSMYAWVPTILDTFGHPTRLFTINTATPTAPAAGQVGYSGGTYYIHLPGSANPNSHVIEVAVVNNLINVRSGSFVTMQDGRWFGAQSAVVSVGRSTDRGTIVARDCDARFGQSGFGTSGLADAMTCIDCTAWYNQNDGFNHHGMIDGSNAPLMELVRCEGAWNEDEGVSPHEATRLIIRESVFHHNGSAGLTAVNSAVIQISDSEFHHNLRLNPDATGGESAGVTILDTARLISTNLYSRNHPGPGIRVDTGTGATWTDNGGTRSGTAHGNGAEDVV